jgi:hypothetical protein
MRKLTLVLSFFLVALGASAQSLKPGEPYPLQEGINQGTSDSLVGVHYWYFYVTPGSNRLTVRFKTPTTLYGTELSNNILTITVTDEKRTWKVTKIVSSNKNLSEAIFLADKVKTKIKIIVSVAPPNQQLLRMGGDYQIEATGDVEFDEVKSKMDPIVRTYDPKTMHYSESYGATKFLADGTVETANGFTGTWKVFDRENRIYAIVIGKIRYSLQYLPGYGLVRPSEPNIIEFQELRR